MALPFLPLGLWAWSQRVVRRLQGKDTLPAMLPARMWGRTFQKQVSSWVSGAGVWVFTPRLGSPQPRPGNLLPSSVGYPGVLTFNFPTSCLFLFQIQAEGSRGTRKGPVVTRSDSNMSARTGLGCRLTALLPQGDARNVLTGQCGKGPGNWAPILRFTLKETLNRKVE